MKSIVFCSGPGTPDPGSSAQLPCRYQSLRIIFVCNYNIKSRKAKQKTAKKTAKIANGTPQIPSAIGLLALANTSGQIPSAIGLLALANTEKKV